MIQRILTCPDPSRWLERIARMIVPQGDCWRWIGTLDHKGYGKFSFRLDGVLKHTGAHRASWLAHRGDIPETLITDHLCRNRWCVNPWHMELVTNQINILRGDHSNKKGRSGRRTRDARGHSCGKHGVLDGYISTMKNGYQRWVCRICAKQGQLKWRAKKQDVAS